MGVSTKVGAFTTLTTLNATLDVTCGFQPKAIIVWYSGITGATDTCTFGDGNWGWGFGTQTEQCCMMQFDNNGAAAQDVKTLSSNSRLILTFTPTASDTQLALDAVANWPSDGFRIKVLTGGTEVRRVGFFAIGGSDITNVDLHDYADGVTLGNIDIAITGNFQPDIIFFLAWPAVENSSGSALSSLGFGVARTASEQGVLAIGQDDGSASSDTAAYCLDAECAAHLDDANPTAVNNRSVFVQMNADGFRINQAELSDAISPGVYRVALCIKGGAWKCGNLLTQTNTSTTIPISGLGATPKGVLVASAIRAESTADTATAPLRMSVGAATSASERHAQGLVSSSGDGNMRVVRAVEHDSIYTAIVDPGADGVDGAAGTLEGLMDVQSVDSDGFTFIMDDADVAQSFAWWVMVGEAGAGGQTATPTAASAVWSAIAPTIVPGAVTITATAVAAAWTPNDVSVSGAQTVQPTAASMSWSAVTPIIVSGAVTITATSSLAVWSVVTPTIVPGGVSILATATTAAWEVVTPAVVPGAVNIVATSVLGTWSAAAPTIVAGAVTITTTAATAAWTPNDASVAGAQVVEPAAALTSWSVVAPVVIPGGVAAVATSAEGSWTPVTPVIVPGGVSIVATSADAAWASVVPVIVPGETIIAATAAFASWMPITPEVMGGGEITQLLFYRRR